MFDATQQYATVGVGVGWGVIIFIVHEHMFDACYATVEVGVWWGVITFIDTCLMLRNSWGWGGVGCDNFHCT